VNDASGEWFEIFNHSLYTIDINGWHLKGQRYPTTIRVPMAVRWKFFQGGLLLLANNGNVSTNGGITPDYVYFGFNLGNISDE